MSQPKPGLAALLGALLLAACGGGSLDREMELEPPPPPVAPSADVTVLMMGNSHTTVNQLPQQLEVLLRAGLPGKSVAVAVAPGWMFLDERLADSQSLALLRSREWTAVVLQAQKYSTTGMYQYSTAEAGELVQEARRVKALPVLFPEWPRRGVPETGTIYDLHVSIARQQPACVAPIGQAWDLARERMPALALHAADGNHSTLAGAHLTALMLYATLTGASPQGLPALDMGIDGVTQTQLRQVAADAAQAYPPRRHCPADMAPAAQGLGAGNTMGASPPSALSQ
ncbi:MAG: hypothetical protein IV097_10210 [Burkholderiaceae bacterium]|nr:hypothetical protein [Burkholderiaceae bacterium]